MKTEPRNNHDLSIFLAATMMVLAMLACNLPAQSNSPDQGTPTNGSGQGTPNSTQPGSGAQAACLAGIFPGKTTRIEVLALLGNPLTTQPAGGQETMFYASAIYGQLNSIVVQNEVVTLVSVVQAEGSLPKWSEVKAQFGEPAHTAYTNYSEGSMIFAFPERGLSFIADETMDVVFIQQCFIPMSLDNYMLAYGNFLPAEDPFIK
jgi:outer membrane protein assembly factor BamE (lipoprotein component of BamABCDE complex)